MKSISSADESATRWAQKIQQLIIFSGMLAKCTLKRWKTYSLQFFHLPGSGMPIWHFGCFSELVQVVKEYYQRSAIKVEIESFEYDNMSPTAARGFSHNPPLNTYYFSYLQVLVMVFVHHSKLYGMKSFHTPSTSFQGPLTTGIYSQPWWSRNMPKKTSLLTAPSMWSIV